MLCSGLLNGPRRFNGDVNIATRAPGLSWPLFFTPDQAHRSLATQMAPTLTTWQKAGGKDLSIFASLRVYFQGSYGLITLSFIT